MVSNFTQISLKINQFRNDIEKNIIDFALTNNIEIYLTETKIKHFDFLTQRFSEDDKVSSNEGELNVFAIELVLFKEDDIPLLHNYIEKKYKTNYNKLSFDIKYRDNPNISMYFPLRQGIVVKNFIEENVLYDTGYYVYGKIFIKSLDEYVWTNFNKHYKFEIQTNRFIDIPFNVVSLRHYIKKCNLAENIIQLAVQIGMKTCSLNNNSEFDYDDFDGLKSLLETIELSSLSNLNMLDNFLKDNFKYVKNDFARFYNNFEKNSDYNQFFTIEILIIIIIALRDDNIRINKTKIEKAIKWDDFNWALKHTH